MKPIAVGVSILACGLLWALAPQPAGAQDEAPTVSAQDFLRGDQDTAPDETRKLIARRDALVNNVEWQQNQLQIADTQRRIQKTQAEIAVAQAKLDENKDKLTKLEALLTPALKASDPDLYAQTEAKLPELKGAIAVAEAQIQAHQAWVNVAQNLVNTYMTANPPSATKYTRAADAETYERFGKDVQHLYKQARSIVHDYGYATTVDQSSFDAADPADLMMTADGEWPDTLSANAFVGKGTVAAYLNKVWTAQKAAGFSEADVEVAKKMVVTALMYTTQYRAQALDDAALVNEIKRTAEDAATRILGQNRVTVQDLNTMYDLLIDTVDKTHQSGS